MSEAHVIDGTEGRIQQALRRNLPPLQQCQGCRGFKLTLCEGLCAYCLSEKRDHETGKR